jgi:hypothetical protein
MESNLCSERAAHLLKKFEDDVKAKMPQIKITFVKTTKLIIP